jgi:hypothetical protein
MRVVVELPVELWYNDHRVAVIYQSYGTMFLTFWWLEGSYCTIYFILKYKLSPKNTILLTACQVQLNSPNCNSTV